MKGHAGDFASEDPCASVFLRPTLHRTARKRTGWGNWICALPGMKGCRVQCALLLVLTTCTRSEDMGSRELAHSTEAHGSIATLQDTERDQSAEPRRVVSSMSGLAALPPLSMPHARLPALSQRGRAISSGSAMGVEKKSQLHLSRSTEALLQLNGNERLLLKTAVRKSGCRGHVDCKAGSFCASRPQVCKECWECTQNGIAVDGRCPVECAGAARQDDPPDRDPPRLGWAFFDDRLNQVKDPSIRLKPGKQVWVDFYIYVEDLGSGFRAAVLVFTSTTQSGVTSAIKVVSDLAQPLTRMLSGTSNGGVLKIPFWFDYRDEAGRWGLRYLQLSDNSGNWRLYTDIDILLFGSRVNATIEVRGQESNYVPCEEAKNIRCGSNAQCFNQCHLQPTKCFGKCACIPGYSGNEFACVRSAVLTEYYRNGTTPSGTMFLAEQKSGLQGTPTFVSQEVSQEDIDREYLSASSHPWEGNGYESSRGTASSQSAEDDAEYHDRIQVPVTLLMCISCVGCILCFQMVWRRRLWKVGLFLEELHRRRARRRTHSEGSAESRRTPRFEAWTHVEDGTPVQNQFGADARRTLRGTRGSISEEMDELTRGIAWSLQEMQRRERDSRGTAQIESYAAPRPPPPVSLPAHLQNPTPAAPGEVEEMVPEGQECAICMEKKRNCRLEPCGHKDLCHLCAEHVHKNSGTCPICRSAISSVILSPG